MSQQAEQEFQEQESSQEGLEDIEIVVEKERLYQVELEEVYKQKEEEYKQLRQQYQELADNINDLREKQYNQNYTFADPYLKEYIKELEEQQLGDLEQSRIEIKQEKQEKIEELKRFQSVKTQLAKMFFTPMEISSHLQISYKNMLENLNQELFQYMQERADLEDEQCEFDKRLKSLRSQIREVTEKNQKLIQQIENIKQAE